MTKEFAKFARKNRIFDETLVKVIGDADQGIVDADLAGCLIKLRVPRLNEGKSGGYRTIVAFQAQERAVFLYGFAKNQQPNISEEEQDALERLGRLLLGLDDQDLSQQIEKEKLRELL